eukprot:2571585-Rhodomonas_salina.1
MRASTPPICALCVCLHRHVIIVWTRDHISPSRVQLHAQSGKRARAVREKVETSHTERRESRRRDWDQVTRDAKTMVYLLKVVQYGNAKLRLE